MTEKHPQYFNLEETPCRIMTDRSHPEIYRGGGKWETYMDRFRLMNESEQITASASASLVLEFDAARKA